MALGLSFKDTLDLIRSFALLGAVILAWFMLHPEEITYYDKNLCVTYLPTIKLIANQTYCTVYCEDLAAGTLYKTNWTTR